MKRLLLFFCAVSLCAQTTTNIAQTITGSDGHNSNGTLLVRISAACQSGSTYVDQRTVAINFLNGALSLGLIPNDTCSPLGTTYAATFMTCSSTVSGATTAKPCPTGATQSFTQTWSVPTSTSTLTINQLTGLSSTAGGGDVTGPITDLTVIGIQGVPVTSTAPTDGQLMQYVASAGKWEPVTVNLSGSATQLQGVPIATGAPSDGQMLRYSASAGQWAHVTPVTQEVLTGTLDGTNAVFTVAHSPVAGLRIKRNGLEQFNGSAGDYAVSGNTVTFSTASTPQSGDVLTADYIY